MTGAETEAVQAALQAAALRLPLAPWITPEVVAEVVDGVLTHASLALAIKTRRPRKTATVAAELDAVRAALRGLAASVAALSPEAVAEIRRATLILDHPRSALGLEVARLDVQAGAAQEQLKRRRGSDRPATPKAAVGRAIVRAIEHLTGKPATFTTDPITNAVTGPGADFVRDALAALGIEASAEHVLRGARDRRRQVEDCKRARAARR